MCKQMWLVSINELLERLNSAEHKVICYADDLAVLVTSKHETELTRLMQGGLNIVNLWADQSNHKINPGKTEIFLFSRKRSCPITNTPEINGERLVLRDVVKYLGVTLASLKKALGGKVQENYKNFLGL